MILKRTILFFLGLAIILCIFWSADFVQHRALPFVDDGLLEEVIGIIETRYVEEVNTDTLVTEALNSFLETLDPNTVYMNTHDYNVLETNTSGQFNGLGINISIRNHFPTAIASLPDTPAGRVGIKTGDVIIEVNGESTLDWKLDKVMKKLRGLPKTKIKLTIQREGMEEPFELELERDVIKIHSVSNYFLTGKNNDIAYILVERFSENTAEELTEAFKELSKQHNLRGMILDLRGNLGGLLTEAVEVSDIFIPKNKMIVYTKGRTPLDNQKFKANHHSLMKKNFPLIVLVNEGAASASEIVAGAIQDWDIGLIMGEPTYGKGSIQSVIPLSDDSALKITVARYYTPVGRCIDKYHNGLIDTTDMKEYHTKRLKRPVYGGGGIKPDIIVKMPPLNEFIGRLQLNSLLFNFGVYYSAHNSNIKPDLQIDNIILEDFREYIEEQEFDYTEEEWEANKDELSVLLRINIINSVLNEEIAHKVKLESDIQFQKALNVLAENKTLKQLFNYAENLDKRQ